MTRGYIFDSWYEENKGVYFLVRCKNGKFKEGLPVRIPTVSEDIY